MKYFTSPIIFLFFACSLFANKKGDVTVYTIVTRNDTAGQLHVSTWEEMDTVYYSYYSDATTTLLKTFNVISERICKYANGQLVYSDSKTIVNGNTRDAATTVWKGSHYEIQYGDEKSIHKEKIDFSSVLLFFLEPLDIQETYSELKAKFMGMSLSDKNAYTIDGGWGRKSIYTYNQGLLQKAEINTPIISFELIRQ